MGNPMGTIQTIFKRRPCPCPGRVVKTTSVKGVSNPMIDSYAFRTSKATAGYETPRNKDKHMVFGNGCL